MGAVNESVWNFICAGISNLVYRVVTVFSATDRLKDPLIPLGRDNQGNPLLTLRLIEVRKGKGRSRYLAAVIDPGIFPHYVVADPYCCR